MYALCVYMSRTQLRETPQSCPVLCCPGREWDIISLYVHAYARVYLCMYILYLECMHVFVYVDIIHICIHTITLAYIQIHTYMHTYKYLFHINSLAL